jgi:hypothetical protein
VDCTADVADGVVRLAPTKAVLHRAPAPGFVPASPSCVADCVPILRT